MIEKVFTFHLRPHLLNSKKNYVRKKDFLSWRKKILWKLKKNCKKMTFFLIIRRWNDLFYYVRSCLLKLVEISLKYSNSGIFSCPVARKCFFFLQCNGKVCVHIKMLYRSSNSASRPLFELWTTYVRKCSPNLYSNPRYTTLDIGVSYVLPESHQ